MTEDEMVGWHHRVNGHEFEHALGDGEVLGSYCIAISWACVLCTFPCFLL